MIGANKFTELDTSPTLTVGALIMPPVSWDVAMTLILYECMQGQYGTLLPEGGANCSSEESHDKNARVLGF